MRRHEPILEWPAPIYGVGVAMLGATTLAYRAAVLGLEPIPQWLGSAALPLAYVAAAVLVVAGAMIAVRRGVRRAAQAIGIVLSVWLILNAIAVAGDVHSGSKWVCACETLALWSAAWALVATVGEDSHAYVARDSAARGAPIPISACIAALGAACIVFGISHFVYIGYVASVLPDWLPWHRFWGYFTGVAHLAAGIALLTRIRAHLAATLLGVMFGSWVLMLHLPRVVRMSHVHSEWTSMWVALAMCGTSFVIAAVLARAHASELAPSAVALAEAR